MKSSAKHFSPVVGP